MTKSLLRFGRVWYRDLQDKAVLLNPEEEGNTILRNVLTIYTSTRHYIPEHLTLPNTVAVTSTLSKGPATKFRNNFGSRVTPGRCRVLH